MNTSVLRRGLGLVLMYIVVFFLLILLQFGRSGGFLAKSGRLTVSASYSTSDRKGPPTSVKIDFAGLVMSLSRSSPARIGLADGSAAPIAVRAVEKIPGGARILFEGGGEIRAVADAASTSFKLSATRPRAEATNIRIDYSLGGRSVFDSKRLFQAGGIPYELVLDGASLESEDAALILSFADGSASRLALRKLQPPAAVVAVKQPAPAKVLPQAPMDAAVFKADLEAFVAKTWAGLSTTRWDQEKLAWRNQSGLALFSERALAAYLAEAAIRGGWAEGYARARSVAARNASSLSWLTTPYFGDTVDRMAVRESQDLAEVKRLVALSQAGDSSLLEKEGLVSFLLDRSPWSLAQSALQAIGGFDATKLTIRGATGYIAASIEARSYLQDADNPFKSVDAVSDRLIGALVKTQDGWFLKTDDDGSVDLRLSLAAGQGLIAWGSASGKDVLVGVGQSLVVSALALADPSGFLPARLAPKPDGSTEKSGSLAPEDCYTLVASTAYYPREISLYRELGPGVWAFTCVPALSATSSFSSAVITVNFPTSYAHYMAIYGLKPFSTIKLYGINYSPDSAFESYDVSGYLYRKATNALYLKMKHKQGAEKIELYY